MLDEDCDSTGLGLHVSVGVLSVRDGEILPEDIENLNGELVVLVVARPERVHLVLKVFRDCLLNTLLVLLLPELDEVRVARTAQENLVGRELDERRIGNMRSSRLGEGRAPVVDILYLLLGDVLCRSSTGVVDVEGVYEASVVVLEVPEDAEQNLVGRVLERIV